MMKAQRFFPKRGFVNYLSSRQAQHTVRLEVVSSTAVRVSGPEGGEKKNEHRGRIYRLAEQAHLLAGMR
jgi:hypothetical protein